MGRLARRFVAVFALVGVNAFLVAAAPGEAHPRGECIFFDEIIPYCSCEEKIVFENCHFDQDCNWSICDL